MANNGKIIKVDDPSEFEIVTVANEPAKQIEVEKEEMKIEVDAEKPEAPQVEEG